MRLLFTWAFSLLAYALCARAALSISNRRLSSTLFAITNIAAFAWLSMWVRYIDWHDDTILDLGLGAVSIHLFLISLYVAAIAFGYFVTKWFAGRPGWLPWIAFFYPISLLVFYRYFFFAWRQVIDALDWPDWVATATFIGLSYMAFRLSYLVLEVRNGTVEMPTLANYMGFAFFLPTMMVGPINTYAVHSESIDGIGERSVELGRSLMRIIVGATKFFFLANLANQLAYRATFVDDRPHGLLDLGVAMIFYYVYLFCNFAGLVDMGIGLAGIIGVKVKENFNNPFVARNVKDFWNRWHITLSEYVRNVIFAPLSKFLITRLGKQYTDYSISATIVVVFLVVGIWHGVGWQFVIFGLIHAVGVAGNHLYTVWLKKRLGKERYAAYDNNRFVNFVSIVLTFLYVSASFFVFANDRNMLSIIKNALRDGLHF